MELLCPSIKFKNTRTLGTGEMYRLCRNNLQYLIQIERRGNDGGDAMQRRQFVNFAAQLLIGLLIQMSIFNIDCDDARDHLKKVAFLAGEFAAIEGLYAYDANQALNIAKVDNWHRHQTMIFDAICAYFGGKIGISPGIIDQ